MKRILYILCLCALLLSCTKEDRKLALVTQEENIDKYINNLRGVRIARNGGSNRLVFAEGRGTDSLALGDSVKFYYAGYVFSNGKGSLFATNDTLVAKNNGFELSGGREEKVLSSKDMVRGLANGLVGAKAGEKCEVVFSAKYGYDNDVVYNVPKMSPLIFEIWVEGIVKN
jgi:FKBP-type peptidyl-prolyl cis-trans isomerase